MAKIGPVETTGWRRPFDTVDSLARSILYQQLSGKAAATIVGRVEIAVGSSKLTPEAFARHVPGLIEAGATLIGGCCGTTPAHIAAAARALGRPAGRAV